MKAIAATGIDLRTAGSLQLLICPVIEKGLTGLLLQAHFLLRNGTQTGVMGQLLGGSQ